MSRMTFSQALDRVYYVAKQRLQVQLRGKLDRARQLAGTGCVAVMSADFSIVNSFTTNKEYYVRGIGRAQTCSCPDRSPVCQHRLAVRLVMKARWLMDATLEEHTAYIQSSGQGAHEEMVC